MSLTTTMEDFIRDNFLGGMLEDPFGGMYDILGDIFGPWGAESIVIFEDVYRPPVPPVISEVPQTWEELEELHPDLFEPILETRPGRTPDPYPQTVALPPPEQLPAQPDDEEPMAHDWGHLIRQGIGSLTGISDPTTSGFMGSGGAAQTAAQTEAWLSGGGGAAPPSGGDCDGMPWSGGTPPKGYKVVNSCGRGVLRKVRRRRRKRMLTVSDKNDIASIISMVGKGQLAATLMNRGG